MLYITNVLQLVAAIVALVYYKKYIQSPEKYFLFFLWYTFLVDLLGGVVGDVFEQDNYWVYNSYMITSFLFYFGWYYTILKRPIFKKTVVAFGGTFIIVSIASLFLENWQEYYAFTFFVGAVFLLVLTLFHFHQLLNSDEVLIVKYKLSFWISTGLLLFYMGMIPLIFLLEYSSIENLSFTILLISLNLILYSLYIIGFSWTKKEYNRF